MKTDDILTTMAVVCLMFAAVTFWGCSSTVGPGSPETDVEISTQPEAPSSAGPPPLIVDTSTPLLLEEPDEAHGASPANAENATCFVCHANYRTEFIASRHAEAGIGCTNCHGDSVAHKNDENNTTPPETMYSTDKIDPLCRSCHATHDVSPGKVIARWFERGLDENEAEKLVCTHCHGEHRMKVRTVIWDKSSGKLLNTNKGR